MKNKRLLCVGCILLMGGLSMWAQTHFYYQPPTGFCGDPMPFYDDHSSTFRVYYLQEYRPNELYTFHPVYALETNDLVHYAELGEVLPHGTTGDTDAAIGAGSVIRNHIDNTYYFFYTGNSASGKQCVPSGYIHRPFRAGDVYQRQYVLHQPYIRPLRQTMDNPLL